MGLCEYCGYPIIGRAVRKILLGTPHEFCTETCFVLYFYKYPKEKVYLDYSKPPEES